MTTHRSVVHRTHAAPAGLTHKPTQVQTFFNERLKYFSIDPDRQHHLDPGSPQSRWETMIANLSAVPEVPVEVAQQNRDWSPLLRATD